jgi:dephospho-CoA kinase
MTLNNSKSLGKIYFITGVSGSGKSTIYNLIKNNQEFKDFDIHDLDENGVPKDGRTYWRRYRIEELFANAIEKSNQGISSILCGIVFPYEILESSRLLLAKPENISFILIDITDEDIAKRLSERTHIQDEVENHISENIRSAYKLRAQIGMLKNSIVLNNSKNKIEKTIEEIKLLLSGTSVA